MDNALKARALYIKDKEYIVHNDEVLIVDQFTGRVQQGRRYSEGLHQAIEAKERVPIKQESKTLATISYQNYFRMYSYLAGMTGTAMTEAEEFQKIYKLDVVRVPTYKPVVRKDHADVIYKTEKAKFSAVVDEIKKLYEMGRPVLAGTTSIEKSEYLSTLLKKEGIPHEVLNAKRHEHEAKIVAQAGKKNTVTIATNMAGRGTDIKLEGEVKDLGGLHIIGTERHEARRIDNQLRGRSGRLGDPGSSRFYLSLEDHLMRVFGGDMMKALIGNTLPDDVPLESRMLTTVLERAQQKVESMNFDIRRRLVEYDDVLNQQREIVYKMRKVILILLHDEKMPPFTLLPEGTDRDHAANKFLNIEESEEASFLKELSSYSLTDPENQKVRQYVSGTFMDYSIRLWIFKQIIDQIEAIVGELTKLDQKLSEKQATLLLDYLDTCIPNELQDLVAREISKKDYAGFTQELIDKKGKTRILRVGELLRLLLTAFYKEIEVINPYLPEKEYERYLVMSTLDYLWMDHIDAMSDLREGITMRGYAQRDPLVEYKREGAQLFEEFFSVLGDTISRKMYHLRVAEQPVSGQEKTTKTGREAVKDAVSSVLSNKINSHNSKAGAESKMRVGRNDPCWCGSGKKYKKCHMPLDMAA